MNNNLLHLEGLTSWDEESKVMNELSPDVSVDMTDSSASPYKIVDGKPATDADGNLYTNNAKTPGYSITTGDYDVAQNYQVVETKVGHVNIAKADLQVKVGNAKLCMVRRLIRASILTRMRILSMAIQPQWWTQT